MRMTPISYTVEKAPPLLDTSFFLPYTYIVSLQCKYREEGNMPKTGEPLTRQRILEAALHLIDREGLEGFSMRKLGAVLGVEAMSLYNHVESKRALFDGVIEQLIVQSPNPEQLDGTPREELWA